MEYSYDYSGISPDVVGGILGAVFGVLLVTIVVVIALCIIFLAAYWKMLKKGGEEGWKSLIPYYNAYTMCKVVGVNPWWILIIIIAVFLSAVPLIGLVGAAACIYYTIIFNVSIARSFGKDAGFAIGLIFLPIIFYPILGFGKAEYLGPRPMNDPILNKVQESVNNNTASQTVQPTPEATVTEQSTQPAKFCPNCGTNLTTDSTFCANCGTKVN